MSNFYNPPEQRTARNAHRCSYCGEPIDRCDKYMHQTGVWEGKWFTSKMHPECFNDMCESGDGEYTPYDNERPETGKNQCAEALEALK